MIRAILSKELLEHRRSKRLHCLLSLMLVLVVGALLTAWSTYTTQRRTAIEAQTRDQEAFLKQGEKAPHAAAHFGRMAYKPPPALAVFDPGATPYLGQVVWLEAHRQDPAMFRPAEDSPELRRLADLSVAGVLILLSPLILSLVGYGVVVGERERGSLRQIMSAGVRPSSVYVGKLAGLAVIGVTASTVVICASLAVALAWPSTTVGDTLVRGAGLLAAYAAYNIAFAAIVVAISARARSSATALMLLLCVWLSSVVLGPRLASSLGERIYPTPDAGAFWSDASAVLRAQQMDRAGPAYRSLQREVLSRALGREVEESEIASVEVNRFGLALEISERLGARAYADAYRTLYETYENQQRIRRLVGLVSPAVLLHHVSSALAGTDVAAHRRFATAAEQQRHFIIRAMNEDLMRKGAGRGFDYLADARLWRTIPDFAYEPPDASFALRVAAADLALLFCWTLGALCVAAWTARKEHAL